MNVYSDEIGRIVVGINVMFGSYADLEGKRMDIRYDLYCVTQKPHSTQRRLFSPANSM